MLTQFLFYFISNDINVTILSFSCCSFSQVLRSINGLVHSFASLVLFCNSHGVILIYSLPAHVLHVGMIDGSGP